MPLAWGKRAQRMWRWAWGWAPSTENNTSAMYRWPLASDRSFCCKTCLRERGTTELTLLTLPATSIPMFRVHKCPSQSPFALPWPNYALFPTKLWTAPGRKENPSTVLPVPGMVLVQKRGLAKSLFNDSCRSESTFSTVYSLVSFPLGSPVNDAPLPCRLPEKAGTPTHWFWRLQKAKLSEGKGWAFGLSDSRTGERSTASVSWMRPALHCVARRSGWHEFPLEFGLGLACRQRYKSPKWKCWKAADHNWTNMKFLSGPLHLCPLAELNLYQS